jgi:tRNA pseudouridine55 synthase
MSPELNGIVVVDKPGGISSAGVVARIKALFEARKVGHTGTLDPLATGVLICCLNQATRLSRFFLEGDKVYEAEMVLGTVTDTQDATGTVTQTNPVTDVSVDRIQKTMSRFVGAITQVPPAYSALKHRGMPLYRLARRGVSVEKPARKIRINRLVLHDVRLPTVRFSVSCSAGTYVRTLCDDIGRELGCGGHLKALRRTASCGYCIDDAVDFERLSQCKERGCLEKVVIPMKDALSFMPTTVADDRLAKKISNGMKLSKIDFPVLPQVSGQGVFKVVDPQDHLIAVLTGATETGRLNYCCVFSV